jgi:thymidylate kinase
MLPPLRLISTLCQQLQAAGISYCHWKSTEGLPRSSRGENDLDLLVARGDISRFIEVLQGLGFKEGRLPARKEHAGITNYFGLDEGSGRLVHVHAHYQLVLGDDMTKNYRLPVEEPYLSSAVQGSLFREPSREFEFIVLAIRMILKHGTWDAILGFRGALSPSERSELAYLSTANDAEIRRLLSEHLPYIGVDLFDRCVRSLQPRCPLGFRLRVGHQVERSLSAHARRPPTIDRTLKLWRRACGKLRRILARPPVRARLSTGGALVAVVGGDGAGKTTVVKDLALWLSRYFLIERVHLGKPPASPKRLAVKGLMALQRLPRRPPRFLSERSAELEAPDSLGYTRQLRHVLTARDRYRAYVRSRRLAANGWIVVCDRYPLDKIKLMDGPQLASIGRSSGLGRVQRRLADLERRYYQHIAPPDILLVLRVGPDIAAQRRPEEDPEVVRARCREVWDLDWDPVQASVIDATLPKAQVLSDAKSLVWSSL